MKKNMMMRLAAVLLVGVLLTTSVIGGTFAKYTTGDDGSDTARVAKWGVVVEAKNFDIFKEEYNQKSDTTKLAVKATEDVFAPGTEGKFADIKITGTPEVAVDVKIVATVKVSNTWVDDAGNFYCPIVIKVGNVSFNGLDYANADVFAAAIKKELDDKSAKYEPNEVLGDTYDTESLDISWEWAFEGATGSENNQTDVRDTFIGNAAAAATTDAEKLTITIGVDIEVTQID